MKKASVWEVVGTPVFDLEPYRFRDVRPLELGTGGLSEVAGTELSLEVGGCVWLRHRQDDKIIPPKSVKRLLDLRLKALGRKVSGQEKQEIKQQIITESLPGAMVKTTETLIFIDQVARWCVIGAVGKAADQLREALSGVLGVEIKPVRVIDDPVSVMTRTLQADTRDTAFPDAGLRLGQRCTCQGGFGEKVVVKGVELPSHEVSMCIEDMYLTVNSIGLVNEKAGIEFVLGHDLGLTGIRYSDDLQDQAAEVDTDPVQVDQGTSVFASWAFVVSSALLDSFERVVSALGGVDDL